MFDLPLTILQCWFDKTFFNLETLFQGTCEEYSSNLWSHLIRGVKPCKIYCEMFQKQTKKIAPQAKKAKKKIYVHSVRMFFWKNRHVELFDLSAIKTASMLS